MRSLTEMRVLAQPIDDVFAYLADFSNGPDWDPGVRDARRDTSAEPVGVGSAFLLNVRFAGQVLPMRYTLLVHEAPHTLVFEGMSKTSRVKDTIRLVEHPSGTHITWRLDVSLLGFRRLGEPFIGPALETLGRNALDGLKARCERPLQGTPTSAHV